MTGANKNPSSAMFDYAARVKESPVRDGIEYNFCLKASQHRDESWQTAADQKAEIKHRFDMKAGKTVDELYNSIESGKWIDPTKSTKSCPTYDKSLYWSLQLQEDSGCPQWYKYARVKGLTEFSIDSVVDCTTGILSLSVMDIHVWWFSDRMLFQTDVFSKNAPQESDDLDGPVDATEQWREEDLLVEAVFREGDESVFVDQQQCDVSNEVNGGSVEVNWSNEVNGGTAEMNGGAVEVNGGAGGGKEKVNVKEGNSSKRLKVDSKKAIENVSGQWPSPYHSKWERVSGVSLEGALRVKLNSVDGNELHKEPEKTLQASALAGR
ncbi:hypothetical protein HDU76_010673 [Blyttiomyces sp. JEL0837]|nr:hypothetical protein HDU76_010673 [Blyttiomyces sp. JEL0837]